MEKFNKNDDMYSSDDMITRSDRSPYVRDHDYGSVTSYEMNHMDLPVYAVIEYSDTGQIIKEDYSKLDKVLKEVIEESVKETRYRDPMTGESTKGKTIQGNVLVKLKLSEIELAHAINYLSEQNILVRGIDNSLDHEVENYQYISTYKNETLPKALTREENDELFHKLKMLKLKIVNAKNKGIRQRFEQEMHSIRNQLIEGNMRLAASIIYRMTPSSFSESDKEDLKQLGYEILINLVDKHDIDRGAAFSTFLYNYLALQVWNRYNKEQSIVIPPHIRTQINKMLKIKSILEQEWSFEITPEVIAAEMILPVEKVKKLLQIYEMYMDKSISESESESLEESLNGQRKFYSEEDEEEIEIDEVNIERDFEEQPEIAVINNDLHDQIIKVLKTLSEREERVLRLRFGLDGDEPKTLDQVAKIFGVTKERIRQIEARALRRLRHPLRSRKLPFPEKDLGRYDNNSGRKRR